MTVQCVKHCLQKLKVLTRVSHSNVSSISPYDYQTASRSCDAKTVEHQMKPDSVGFLLELVHILLNSIVAEQERHNLLIVRPYNDTNYGHTE